MFFTTKNLLKTQYTNLVNRYMINSDHPNASKDGGNVDFKLLMTDRCEQQRLVGILIRVAKDQIDGNQ